VAVAVVCVCLTALGVGCGRDRAPGHEAASRADEVTLGRYGPGVQGPVERQVADAVIRLMVLPNTAGCPQVMMRAHQGWCRGFVAWSNRPRSLRWIDDVQLRSPSEAQALALFNRQTGGIGFVVRRTATGWKVFSTIGQAG
jgi:hypothetical protein